MSTAGIFKDPSTGSYYFSPAVIRTVVESILVEHGLFREYPRLADFITTDLLSAALDADGVPPLTAREVEVVPCR